MLKCRMLVLLLLAPLVAPVLASAATLTDDTLSVDGVARRYLVHDFSNGTPAPLVIMLHGGGGSGANMAEQTGFDTLAQREGLIAVYPYGSGGLFANILLTWNAAHCCSYAMRENTDDVRFLTLLIDKLIASGKVDADRVYVSGLSNGGMMTHRVGIELSSKVAAIAPVIASLYGDEPLREFAMPTLIINGAVDQRVKPEGGELQGFGFENSPADKPTLPINSQRDYWAKVNGCTAFTDTETTAYFLRSYQGCRQGGAVQSYVVKNNGHAWPGGTAPRGEADQPVQTVNANEVIWAFFRQYKRSAANVSNTAYYYDGSLRIPGLSAEGKSYSATLFLRSSIPLEFELSALSATGSPLEGMPVYTNGKLMLDKIAIGAEQRSATLTLTNTAPVRLRVSELK